MSIMSGEEFIEFLESDTYQQLPPEATTGDEFEKHLSNFIEKKRSIKRLDFDSEDSILDRKCEQAGIDQYILASLWAHGELSRGNKKRGYKLRAIAIRMKKLHIQNLKKSTKRRFV